VSDRKDGLVRADERLVAIVGNYGSGKTEVAVNLALRLAAGGRTVQIADLDLVNPYFRCREARRLMEAHGIRVVVPDESRVWADLPIVLPEVRGMLRPPPGTISLLDVGGDDVGARALASFRPDLQDGAYELWLVLNAQRPFTADAAGCLHMLAGIEASSRLRVTGLVANAHLMDETTPDTVLAGARLAAEVAERSGLPVRAIAVLKEYASDPRLRALHAPLLELRRRMLPPWLKTHEINGRTA